MNEPARKHVRHEIGKDPGPRVLIPPKQQVEVDELVVALLLELCVRAKDLAVVAPRMAARADTIGEGRVAPCERAIDDAPIIGAVRFGPGNVSKLLILVEMDKDRNIVTDNSSFLSRSTATLRGVPMSVFVSQIPAASF